MTGASNDIRAEDVLRRTMAAMEGFRERLERKIAAEREPIAVVGVGCRFPGIEGPEEFSRFLREGRSLIGRLHEGRAAASAGPRAMRYRAGGFFEDVAGFDAEAFGIGEDEARAMDPHLRFLLEVARDAIEDAALADGQLGRTRTAVIMALGAQNNDYAAALAASPAGLGKHAIPGSFHSLMPGRLSYHFDLRGPSFVVDAACASSLVAVDLACQSLRRGDCDYALVAAVNLVLSDVVSSAIDASGLWSATGRCRSFDDAADGFVRGEGAAVLVLRRASDAARDGDPVRSLILGAASGQDGRGNGIAAPNAPAQAAIMRRALDQAGVSAREIGYVEAHATGTRLGDAIEVEALDEVYGSAQGRPEPLLVGALKPALGHLEAASGMAALVRAIIARAENEVPASIAPQTLNDEIAVLGERIAPATFSRAWPDHAPYAAISAFGMSGTNAHVIIGPPPSGADSLAPRRLSLPMTPFRRRRFWPEIEPVSPAAKPIPVTEDLFVSPSWDCAPSALPDKPQQPFVLVGDERLLTRLSPELAQAGIEVATSKVDDVAPDAPLNLLVCAGRSFSDLAALHRRLKLLAARSGQTRLVLVTEGGAGGNALAAAMIGLGRAICVEHPELQLRMIDLDPGSGEFGQVFAQALATDGESVMRISGESLLVLRLRRDAYPHVPMQPDPKASHLVTGGFGGIGRALSRLLVQRGARHLILLGRHAKTIPEQAEFEMLGVSITTVAADVADREAVERAFDQAAEAGRPIASVFHAAGMVSNDLLVNQEPEDFAAPFRAKLLGASVLDAVTRGRDLDAFVLLSSITAFMPLAGAAAYGAANASLGAIARARHRAGLPALCVYSGTWEGSGMLGHAGDDMADRWAQHGISIMPQEDALAGVESLLAAKVAECTVARLDWSRIASHAARESSGTALYGELVPAATGSSKPHASAAVIDLETELPAIVRSAVARACDLDPQDPGLAAPFGELGLDSLAAIGLRNDLSINLGLRLPASLAFNYPSVQAMIDFLAKRLREREGAAGE